MLTPSWLGGTLLNENPSLTVKSQQLREKLITLGLPENPTKVGVISIVKSDLNGNFFTKGSSQLMIFTTTKTPPQQIHDLENKGVQVFVTDDRLIDLSFVMQTLYDHGIRRLMVEGGGTLIASMLKNKYVDELITYIAPIIFSGRSAPTLADGDGFLPGEEIRLHLLDISKYDNEGGILAQYSVKYN